MSSFAMVGLLELLTLISGGGILGMPPGELDPVLRKCAGEQTLLYMEWAGRGAGKAGAEGIDGLVADPEIVAFVEGVKKAILDGIAGEIENAPPFEQTLANNIPGLVLKLISQPGCLYITFDADAAQKALQEYGGELGPGAAALGLRATVIFSGGDESEAIAKHLGELLDLLPAELRANGLKNQSLPLPPPLGNSMLTLHREGNHFILGFGEGTVKQAIAGVTGTDQGFSKHAGFQAGLQKVKMERTAGVAFLDIEGIIQAVAGALGPGGQLITASVQLVGADALKNVTASSGVIDGQINTKTFIKTNGKTENILSVAAGRKLTAADFAHVPADADLVFGFSFNAPAVLNAVKSIIAKADPESAEIFESDLEQIENELGLKLSDIFAAFGDAWTLYDSPSAGGVLLTSPVAGLEIKDHDKAQAVFMRMMQLLEATLPGDYGNSRYRRRAVNLVKKEFMDHTVYFINTIGDDDVPVSPAFCVTKTHLLVALHPQALKAHLRFGADHGENFANVLAKNIPLPEGEQICLSYVDSSTVVRLLYSLAPYFGSVIYGELQSEGIALDVFSLPSARALLPYLKNSHSSITRTPEGILIQGQNALPIPGLNGSLMTVFPMMLMGISTRAQFDAVGEELNDIEAVPQAAPAQRVRIRVQAVPAQKTRPAEKAVEPQKKVAP